MPPNNVRLSGAQVDFLFALVAERERAVCLEMALTRGMRSVRESELEGELEMIDSIKLSLIEA